MKAFEYVEPGTVEGVTRRLTEADTAAAIAGGMDLIGLMKNWVAQPDRVVSLKGVEGLSEVSTTDAGTTIGALVTIDTIATDPALSAAYPALSAAAATVGTPQIRNRGTLGGNLCQRPRCWYFRSDLFNCLKKGGDACFAQGGDNRYHAIFGNDRCAIVHPSSCAPPLIAYGATVSIAGQGGERSVAVEDLFVRPEDNVQREHSLRDGEIITAVHLPDAAAVRSATYVVKFKQSHDWPLAIASVALHGDGETVNEARVVLGAVAPVPWRSAGAEAALTGQRIDESVAGAAADAAVADAEPMQHNGYKVHIARTAVKRAIMAAASA